MLMRGVNSATFRVHQQVVPFQLVGLRQNLEILLTLDKSYNLEPNGKWG